MRRMRAGWVAGNAQSSVTQQTDKQHWMTSRLVQLSRDDVMEIRWCLKANKIQLGSWKEVLNSVRHNSGSETMEHFLIKAAVTRIIVDNGRHCATEVKIGKGVTNVVDITYGMIYEIESEPSETIAEEKMAKYRKNKPGFNYVVEIISVSEVPLVSENRSMCILTKGGGMCCIGDDERKSICSLLLGNSV